MVDAGRYRERAMTVARAATAALNDRGVIALVTGSLARGHFGPHPDIDFLVTSCPPDMKYAIEGVVEDILHGLPFDVICLDEIPAWKAPRFSECTGDASDLR